MTDEVEIVDARARLECPGLDVQEGPWREHLRALVTADNHASLHAGDLLLAFACAERNGIALRIFEERHGAMLAEAVSSVERANAADVLQDLRCRLFLADVAERRPRVLGYRGTGPLGGWVRVAALRLAIDLKRGGWREVSVEEALVPDPGHAGGSELAQKNDHVVLRSALRAAIAAQTSRTRTLLRYYYSENVGVEDLGAIYGVHASTVSRWLATARTEIFQETRRSLAEALKASPLDVESHLGLAHDLDLSLASLLRTPSGSTT